MCTAVLVKVKLVKRELQIVAVVDAPAVGGFYKNDINVKAGGGIIVEQRRGKHRAVARKSEIACIVYICRSEICLFENGLIAASRFVGHAVLYVKYRVSFAVVRAETAVAKHSVKGP